MLRNNIYKYDQIKVIYKYDQIKVCKRSCKGRYKINLLMKGRNVKIINAKRRVKKSWKLELQIGKEKRIIMQ